ncbi:MAG: 50S ribosomal protein L23 [Candidatus Pacebacteria bacterium]|nr:50S ribosomal protein L23 [Candidatus Paceibacterota bacterium]
MTDKKTQQNKNDFANMRASEVLLRPRLTEKAINMMDKGIYVFDVSLRANKVMIASAIKEVYKVEPVKIAISSIKSKKKRNPRTGKIGTQSGGKKAYIYLKKGDSISIM